MRLQIYGIHDGANNWVNHLGFFFLNVYDRAKAFAML